MSDPFSTPKLEVSASPWSRRALLMCACLAGIVLVGFLKGITESTPTIRAAPSTHHTRIESAVPAARSYNQLASATLSPNANWTSDLAQLKFPRPGLFDPVVRTDAMKLATLTDRAKTRAFDGAPPVIPHPVEQQSAASCLACHGEGLKLGDRIATRMSHARFENCTQCHVELQSSGPWLAEAGVANEFRGRGRAGPGQRALAGSPPTIPHTTWLRESCLSCHGLVARPGLRTTHPWLSNCLQCHAPSAELDQAPAPSPFPQADRPVALKRAEEDVVVGSTP